MIHRANPKTALPPPPSIRYRFPTNHPPSTRNPHPGALITPLSNPLVTLNPTSTCPDRYFCSLPSHNSSERSGMHFLVRGIFSRNWQSRQLALNLLRYGFYGLRGILRRWLLCLWVVYWRFWGWRRGCWVDMNGGLWWVLRRGMHWRGLRVSGIGIQANLNRGFLSSILCFFSWGCIILREEFRCCIGVEPIQG